MDYKSRWDKTAKTAEFYSKLYICFVLKSFFPVPYKIHVKNILKNYEKIRIKPSEYVKAYVSSFNP